jgi:hypothetical protein
MYGIRCSYELPMEDGELTAGPTEVLALAEEEDRDATNRPQVRRRHLFRALLEASTRTALAQAKESTLQINRAAGDKDGARRAPSPVPRSGQRDAEEGRAPLLKHEHGGSVN